MDPDDSSAAAAPARQWRRVGAPAARDDRRTAGSRGAHLRAGDRAARPDAAVGLDRRCLDRRRCAAVGSPRGRLRLRRRGRLLAGARARAGRSDLPQRLRGPTTSSSTPAARSSASSTGDTASPGPRVWDVAYLAYRLVPLAGPKNPDLGGRGDRAGRRRRLALLCRTYGHDLDPADVAATAVRRLRELADFAAVRAGAGAPHLDDHARLYRDDADWLGASLQELP